MNNPDSGQDSGQKKLRRVYCFTGMKKALKHKCFKASFGGDKRDRTADLLNAIQALSQLSYTPICKKACASAQEI